MLWFRSRVQVLFRLVLFLILLKLAFLAFLAIWLSIPATKEQIIPQQNAVVKNNQQTEEKQIKPANFSRQDETLKNTSRLIFNPTTVSDERQLTLNGNKTLRELESKEKGPDLAIYVKNVYGRNLNIEYIQLRDNKSTEDNLKFTYAEPYFPKKIECSKLGANNNSEKKATKYVQVYDRYWEQLGMSTRTLMALSGLAHIGGRKVLQPRVKDCMFGREGYSLGIYFNLTHMNSVLNACDYAPLVDKKEYDTECSLSEDRHASVHFLYAGEKAARSTMKRFHLSEQQYKKIRKDAKIKGWTNCSFIGKFIHQTFSSKQFCVDPAVITEWSVLERDILHGAKCLTIVYWRGIGAWYRAKFKQTHFKVAQKDIHYALKPNFDILYEVQKFKKAFLDGRYIAVHVRGEKVVTFHNLGRLRSCIRLLIAVIEVLKQSSGIDKVFVATDMSSFGSSTWGNILKRKSSGRKTIERIHSSLVSSTSGVVYKPTADQKHRDRGVHVLIEMTLVSQAGHLVTIGHGSFQEWVIAKFMEYHRDDSRSLWSLITMCSK